MSSRGTHPPPSGQKTPLTEEPLAPFGPGGPCREWGQNTGEQAPLQLRCPPRPTVLLRPGQLVTHSPHRIPFPRTSWLHLLDSGGGEWGTADARPHGDRGGSCPTPVVLPPPPPPRPGSRSSGSQSQRESRGQRQIVGPPWASWTQVPAQEGQVEAHSPAGWLWRTRCPSNVGDALQVAPNPSRLGRAAPLTLTGTTSSPYPGCLWRFIHVS